MTLPIDYAQASVDLGVTQKPNRRVGIILEYFITQRKPINAASLARLTGLSLSYVSNVIVWMLRADLLTTIVPPMLDLSEYGYKARWRKKQEFYAKTRWGELNARMHGVGMNLYAPKRILCIHLLK